MSSKLCADVTPCTKAMGQVISALAYLHRLAKLTNTKVGAMLCTHRNSVEVLAEALPALLPLEGCHSQVHNCPLDGKLGSTAQECEDSILGWLGRLLGQAAQLLRQRLLAHGPVTQMLASYIMTYSICDTYSDSQRRPGWQTSGRRYSNLVVHCCALDTGILYKLTATTEC